MLDLCPFMPTTAVGQMAVGQYLFCEQPSILRRQNEMFLYGYTFSLRLWRHTSISGFLRHDVFAESSCTRRFEILWTFADLRTEIRPIVFSLRLTSKADIVFTAEHALSVSNARAKVLLRVPTRRKFVSVWYNFWHTCLHNACIVFAFMTWARKIHFHCHSVAQDSLA